MPGLNLTQDEAQERSSLITVYHYDVELDLSGDNRTFRSRTTVDFDASAGASSFIDLIAEDIHAITLNGESLDTDCYADGRIPLSNLAERNRLIVDATCLYMHTGEGLHRFTDPADGLDYCYSQFEVPDSRRVFTVFEQPDMKAQFTFHVTTPREWTVFSNSPTPSPTPVDEARHRFDFSASEQISSYITAIVAGPYVGATGTLTSSDGREIPLGVYCRQSLIEHLDADWVMDVTRAGFAFFEREYNRPYPFRKYDQIFVPEYNAGAMENAGCVTFRDEYIFRSRPTANQLEALANTVLHELAHMWFGDLVTMKWWNDLWLNESFAEFMSHLALAEGTEEWTSAWTGFMARKAWGLNQDQLPSTHPIVAPIRDLEDVEVNFDGITYAKGAAVLRQLVSYVGRDNFFTALHRYFEQHAWANTTLADLMRELETASGRDLTAWSSVWLEEAGVTVLRPNVTVNDDGTIAELAVIQESFTPGSSLRPHRLAVAGYSLIDDRIERIFHEELDVDGARTPVTAATGTTRPDLILVNDGDLAYAKIRLDEDSLAFATTNIAKFPDSLTRSIILASAWDMVRDAELAAATYCDLVLSALTRESDITLFNLWLRQLGMALTLYLPTDELDTVRASVGERLIIMARAASAGSDQQRLLVTAASQRATTDAQLDAIEALWRGDDTLMGLDMDVDLRWSLLVDLAAAGRVGEAEIEAMLEEDSTLTGHQRARQARAAIPEQENKDRVYRQILSDSTLSNDDRIAAGRGYWANVASHPQMHREHVAIFFDSLLDIWQSQTSHTAQDMVALGSPTILTGRLNDVDVVACGQQWLAQNADAPAGLRRLVSEEVADAERAQRVQRVRR